MKRAAIIGGGAWGTALAQVCARAGLEVRLWVREPEVAGAINSHHQNPVFLKGIDLHPGIVAVTRSHDLAGSELIFAAPPAQHFRTVLAGFAEIVDPGTPVVICAKGVEATSLKLMSEVLAEALPQSRPAVLSGPSFADEVARDLPTAVTLAAETEHIALGIARAIATPRFRPYASTDLIGAQAGGSVKNVLAIACGVIEGRGLGANAKAALITRGFAELQRLAMALGGAPETTAGLCGLGDLVLTCSGAQSRNMSLGLALGRGETPQTALAGKRSVAEGVASAPAVVALAARLGVEAPICEAVSDILAGKIAIEPAIAKLLSRPLRTEW